MSKQSLAILQLISKATKTKTPKGMNTIAKKLHDLGATDDARIVERAAVATKQKSGS